MNAEISQQYVRSLFDYNDGNLFWKIKLNQRIIIGAKAGCVDTKRNGKPRNVIVINKKHYLSARIIFLWHNGYLPEFVDHENRNQLDDRINNLRAATKSQNTKNSVSRPKSSSKYRGVHASKRKWASVIFINGKHKHLGYFISENDAALVYNREAVRYHKEFANLNIIQL